VSNAVAELLNQVRSKALGISADRELLSIIDSLEAAYTMQDSQLNKTHSWLSDAQIAAESARKETKLAEKTLKETQTELRIALEKNVLLTEALRLEIARKFGKSSEKWTDAECLQAQLFNEAEYILQVLPAEPEPVAEPATPEAPVATTKINKRRGGRDSFPDSIPRKETILDIPESEKVCPLTGSQRPCIGQDVSEQLEMEPIQFFVRRIIRLKYGSFDGGTGGVVTAPVPFQIYPKSLLGHSVIAQIITNKYCDALPFYRQEHVLARSGISISRQTMARAIAAAAETLSPMKKIIVESLMKCKVLHADETRIRVLNDHGIKKEGNSYMWVLAGTHEGIKLVHFHYGGGRDSGVAKELLYGFRGILMVDGYGAYPAATHGTGIILAACMAHVRRNFHDIVKADSKNPHAREALSLIGKLYAIERDIADATDDERLAARQEKSLPIFEEFRTWLYKQAETALPRSTLGKAVAYAVALLNRLEVFLDNPDLPIDNNRAENCLRPFVIGRKNWLFHAQASGAEDSAFLYSLVETAKANGVEPMHYFQFLFNCYKKFGPDAMPWYEIFPRANLQTYADSIGVPYGFERG
jgi:transposase